MTKKSNWGQSFENSSNDGRTKSKISFNDVTMFSFRNIILLVIHLVQQKNWLQKSISDVKAFKFSWFKLNWELMEGWEKKNFLEVK